jgi:tRNA 2-thiouridine synthesizing protein A
MVTHDQELDARGLNCPMPILRTKKDIAAMESGQVLRVLATDPGAVKDMEAFCAQTDNEFVSSGETGDVYEFFIRKR